MKRLLIPALLIPALLRGAEPLELARRVADKVVDNTRFELEYKLQSAYPDFGCVDFGRCMDRPGVAYALTTLRCEGDTEELFELGCTGPVRITIDDSVVYERPLPHPFAVEFGEKDYRLPESFRLRLTAGPHKLLVKTEYRGGEHLFLMQSRNFSRYAERGRKIFCTLETYAPKLKEARWLVLGTFEGDLATPLAPDSALLFHTPYRDCGRTLAWNIPPIDIVSAPAANGRFFEWYYHVGCFAWALQRLSAATGDLKYAVYADAWCDFSLGTFPLAEHQTQRLHAVRSFNFGTAGRPMLDYVSAPAMPYSTRKSYPSLVRPSMTCTPQATQGSKECTVRRISTGRLGSATGVPISASSTALRWPAASRGPRFQVEGTTSWKLAILPSSMTIQCESPPLGALTKPTPRADFGTSQFSTIFVSPPARLSLSSSSHVPVCRATASASIPRAAVRPRVENRASGPVPSAART